MTKRNALGFLLILGLVAFFGDCTYEGARGIAGPFLGTLGANAAIVGVVAGFGELSGYALRAAIGHAIERTGNLWIFAFLGYFINMLAVPSLALAGNWPAAAALMIAERAGRGLRKPAVDTMLSHAASDIGRGLTFGLYESMDQVGATLGPLLMALTLTVRNQNYHVAFAFLLIPALLCLATLTAARLLYPKPHKLETKVQSVPPARAFSKSFWLYAASGGLFAAGLADFSLVAFHFHKVGVVSQNMIPMFYAVAMVSSAVFSVVFGHLLDKLGSKIVVFALVCSACYAPAAFSTSYWMALSGSFLWGLGMTLSDSLLKAELTAIVPASRRSSAYGTFDAIFGIGWFLGSAAMGFVYDMSVTAVVVLTVALQLAAIPLFIMATKSAAKSKGN